MSRAAVFGACLAISASLMWGQEETPDKRLRHSADVLQEVMSAPDRGVPHDLLRRAECVIVIPGMKKGALVFGGDYGRGFAVCRTGGGWSGPAAVRIGGGSFGAQIGVDSTDVVMLVMNQRGMQHLMSSKFTVGADASAAAGPVGRTATADTDASLHAELLSYSRTRGAFAGVALDGAAITEDHEENRKLYGHDLSNRAIIRGEARPPEAGDPIVAVLDEYSR
ncbi:MAG TPA: lipid-binding SYLF domain-containing protein [Bryobacteraceae bacterium]|nr:lipid-binding SYLF domain-containing protein [Bryobacteraceae bacterium]